jgi:hypothetical protein
MQECFGFFPGNWGQLPSMEEEGGKPLQFWHPMTCIVTVYEVVHFEKHKCKQCPKFDTSVVASTFVREVPPKAKL